MSAGIWSTLFCRLSTAVWPTAFIQLSAAALTAIALAYAYATRHHGKWKALGVPHTEPTPLFGHLGDVMRNRAPLIDTLQSLYRRFDGQRYFGIYEARTPVLVVGDPALAHAVLARDFESFRDRIADRVSFEHDGLFEHLLHLRGDRWKAVRTKLTPTFTGARLRAMMGDVSRCTEKLLEHLDGQLTAAAAADGVVDISEVTAQYATEIIGRCVFGLDFNTISDPNSDFRRTGRDAFLPTRSVVISNFIRFLGFGRLLDLFRIRGMPDHVYHFFDKIVKTIMNLHEKEKNSRNDFISHMIKIKDEEKLIEPERRIFKDDIIAANAFVFFFAGFETTASTMSYCLYELAKNPDIQSKLRENINQLLDANDKKITYDSLKDFKYLEMVINETLRLHPPVPVLVRICTRKYKIPDSDLTLNVGEKLIIPTYSLHRDYKYYPNPEVFDPERFNNINIASIPQGAFLGFSEGPRICIGKRFAMMETKIGLAKILTKYEVMPCKNTKTPIKIKPQSFLLTPVDPICLKLKKID